MTNVPGKVLQDVDNISPLGYPIIAPLMFRLKLESHSPLEYRSRCHIDLCIARYDAFPRRVVGPEEPVDVLVLVLVYTTLLAPRG